MNIPLGLGFAVGFLLSILLHEAATAFVADRLGDKTSRLMRRVTFSIKPHADPLGTIIMPAVFTLGALFASPYYPLFGWGKRHALSPRGLRKPRRDILIVALIGPAVTFALAATAGSAVRGGTGDFARFAFGVAVVAVFITVIELLPMPGRDGGRVLQRFLSPSAAMKFEEFMQYDVLFLLGIFLLDQLLGGTVRGMARPVCELVTGVRC